MAPEQTGRMNRSVDSRSDLYALGITLYEMKLARVPFHVLPAESLAPRIQRNGSSRLLKPDWITPRGVFAVPVSRNFYASLKRRSKGPLVEIYFRIPDEERVRVGHYGQTHRWLSAAEAVAEFSRADDPLGWQVVARGRYRNRIPLWFILQRNPVFMEEGRSLIAPALHCSRRFRGCSWLALWNCSGLCRVGPIQSWRQVH